MEKPADLEAKYHKLAAEYSKVRSQASVLKKAVLEEQARSSEQKDAIKKHEQTIRKHDQEMESLTFRNEQLTKRIGVLQQELQASPQNKKGRNRGAEAAVARSDMVGIIDEELQKKILENAQLVSCMADKEFELNDCRERNEWLETKVRKLEEQLQERELRYDEELSKLRGEQERRSLGEVQRVGSANESTSNTGNRESEEVKHWKEEAERWRTEYETLKSKPESNEQLTAYYETKLKDLFKTKQLAVSEAKSIWAENEALTARLEGLVVENRGLGDRLERSSEEFVTTTENYRAQLDAMTEHLAAQNDKITKQCDEVQSLRHRLASKK